MKADDICTDVAEDVETRFDTSNYEWDRLLPKGKNKRLTGLMTEELGGKFMRKFVGRRGKTCSYLIDDGSKHKKACQKKGKKSVSQKENLNLKIIKTVSEQLLILIVLRKIIKNWQKEKLNIKK